MTVTLIVLSRADDDGRPLRRAQLDLLLRSRAQHWPQSRFKVIDEPAGPEFSAAIAGAVIEATDLVAFATDDGVFHRSVPGDGVLEWALLPAHSDPWLCASLRLGDDTTNCYPTDTKHSTSYHWPACSGDYGYPGSVDAHVFRRRDLLAMIDRQFIPHPTALEVIMNGRCHELFAESRPLMWFGHKPCYTAVPVNRVSSQSNVRSGTVFPQSVEALNARFDAGDRIDLESTFRDAVIDSAHVELPYRWESERAA